MSFCLKRPGRSGSDESAASLRGPPVGGALQVYIVDDTGFAKQGCKSVGVARQIQRHVGQGRQLPGRGLLGLGVGAGPRVGRQGVASAARMDTRSRAVSGTGVPEVIGDRSKTKLALDLLRQAGKAGTGLLTG